MVNLANVGWSTGSNGLGGAKGGRSRELGGVVNRANGLLSEGRVVNLANVGWSTGSNGLGRAFKAGRSRELR